MLVENDTISQELYKYYYCDDVTPNQMVSSHWRKFLKKFDVRMEGQVITSLKGFGFGDLEYQSFPTRFFAWLTNVSYLLHLEKRLEIIKIMKASEPLLQRMGFPLSYDCFRQVCALAMINRYIPSKENIRIINIGDGYGFLSSLLKKIWPQAKICLVDLGKTLFFQSYYCQKAHLEKEHYLVRSDEAFEGAESDFVYCPAELINKLDTLSFDVAINIASMQEMNAQTVDNYFCFLRKHLIEENMFYCCNREEKHMPDGEVSKILDFPWVSGDEHIIDESCPWAQYVLGWRMSSQGPRVLNCRVPFVNYFDGPMLHRLSRLKTT